MKLLPFIALVYFASSLTLRESQEDPHSFDFIGRQKFDELECRLDTYHFEDDRDREKMEVLYGNRMAPLNNQTVRHNTQSFEREVKKLGSIPKTLRTSWVRKFDVMKHNSTLIQQGLQSFVAHNPDWDVEISDNREVDRDLHTYLNSTVWNAVKSRPIVEKIDLWRLLIIYHKGGMYADIDRLFNLDMKTVIGRKTKMLLPFAGMDFSEKDLPRRIFDFSQDFVASAPGNPAIKAAIDLSLDMHLQYKYCEDGGVGGCGSNVFSSSVDFLIYAGARLYNLALQSHIFGIELGSQPSECISKALVEQIKSLSPHVVTYVEHLPCNTILAQDGCAHLSGGTDMKENYEEAKKSFFADEGRGHWFDEVQKRFKF